MPPSTKLQRTRGDPNYRGIRNGFSHEAIELAKQLSNGGATTGEIAEALGISRPTLWAWMTKDEELFNAVKVGGKAADDRVVQSLFEKATVEGDNTAMIFWLKNRRPNEWRDKRDVELGGAIDVTDNSARSMALAALALVRAAVEDTLEPVTIEHEENN